MIDSMTHVQRMLESFSNLQNPSLAKEMANTSVCLENEDGIRANGRFSELPQDILPHDAAQLILETLRALEHSALSDIDTEMVKIEHFIVLLVNGQRNCSRLKLARLRLLILPLSVLI